MKNAFAVDQIDHIELFVPDRYQAAEWYQKTLGLEIAKAFEYWAEAEGGPLMITSAKGGTKLALFEGKPQGKQPTAGFSRVAFRVCGPQFLHFLNLLPTLSLKNQNGDTLNRDSAVDHQSAFSVYFCDPYGHRLEVTSYDHVFIREGLK